MNQSIVITVARIFFEVAASSLSSFVLFGQYSLYNLRREKIQARLNDKKQIEKKAFFIWCVVEIKRHESQSWVAIFP